MDIIPNWEYLPKDAPLIVWNDEDEEPHKRYFAYYVFNENKIAVYADGRTSWTSNPNHLEYYKYGRIAYD